MTTDQGEVAAVIIVPKEEPEEPLYCIRSGCTRQAIRSPEWEDEYCSAECVVAHCKTIFNEWCKAKLEAERNDSLLQKK